MNERFVIVRGLRFCVGEWGKPDAPAVVILHGWMDQALAWDRMAAAVAAAGWRVLVFEQRGHGRSAHTPPGSYYHFPNYVADFDAWVRQEGLEDFVLIGHSMGGTVASLFAAYRSDRLRQLILIEGLGPPEIDDAAAVAQYGRHLDQLAAPPPHKPLGTIADAVARLQTFNPLSDDEALRLAERIVTVGDDGVLRWGWDPLHRIRSAMAFDAARHRLMLQRIRAPTILIFGMESWYLRLPDLEERARLLPNVQERIDLQTGHSPHIENPKMLSEKLLSRLVPAGKQ